MYFELVILFVSSCGLFVNCFSAQFNTAQQNYECPSMCICDLFMDLNRADCRFRLAILRTSDL